MRDASPKRGLATSNGISASTMPEAVRRSQSLVCCWPIGRWVREEGIDGDAVLEVKLDVTEDDLAGFELEGMLWDARV